MSLLEDMGYLPRVAFLMDSLMQRLGLHGTAIIPVVLGYGCTVPAVMATRILPAKRDKIIAGTLVTLVPCSARSIVIMGLAAFYLGARAAVAICLLNAIVVIAVGLVMSRLIPSASRGIIMEMPDCRLPTIGALPRKIWFRIREFIIIAWPLLIAGSVLLGIADWFQWPAAVNRILSPLTTVLGLPATTGTVLVFGILRKELAPIMLMQALGTRDLLDALAPVQIMTFTVLVTFYFPCVGTIAALFKAMDRIWVAIICGITLLVAIALALGTRLVFAVIQTTKSFP
jgi:ferrous iron transport protein B